MQADPDEIEDDWDSEMQIADYYYNMDASPAATVLYLYVFILLEETATLFAMW